MPRACNVCRYPARKEVDAILLEGKESFRNIAKRIGTSPAGVLRHRDRHIPGRMAKAARARDATDGGELLDRLEALVLETQEILREAREGKNHDIALKAIARAESQIELQARLLGQLRDTRLSVHVAFPPEAAERVAAAFLARRSPPVIDTEVQSE